MQPNQDHLSSDAHSSGAHLARGSWRPGVDQQGAYDNCAKRFNMNSLTHEHSACPSLSPVSQGLARLAGQRYCGTR